MILCVFIDFKRAFETIDRQLLIKKLERYGIRNEELAWFTDFLTNRLQKTKFGSKVSSSLPNDYGVPQGSVLAAILFIIFINDMKGVFHFNKFHLFADDTILYIVGNDVEEMVQIMNNELIEFNECLKINKLKLNIEKTKFMLITHNYS